MIVMAKFKDIILNSCYLKARELAADNFSDYFYSRDSYGPRFPHRGAGHRDAYWNGRQIDSDRARYVRGSIAYAFWRAGRDDRKEDMKRKRATLS